MKAPRLTLPQLFGLVALVVALVFVVTYTSILIGTSPPRNSGNVPAEALLQLKFEGEDDRKVKVLPDGEQELQKPGHCDFWFTNDSAYPVDVRVNRKNCKCTQVEICLLPEEWKNWSQAEKKKHAEDPELVWQVLNLEDSKSFTVPAHAAGSVRLGWKGKSLGADLTQAELLTESRNVAGDSLILWTPVLFVEPIQVHAEVQLREPAKPDEVQPAARQNESQVGTLLASDVKTVSFICWSSTRDEFSLKVEQPTDPCVTASKPVRLSKEECKKMSDQHGRRVHCAYRVEVTVREKTPDGKHQLDMGPFRRRVTLTSDPGLEPVLALVSGLVRGEVTIGNPEDHDQVELGSFEKSQGKSRDITLTTDQAGLDLEIVRVPDFLKATLQEEKGVGPLGKIWTLSVRVPPDALSGPIAPHTAFIDLQCKGEKNRLIRIPVTGNAYVK